MPLTFAGGAGAGHGGSGGQGYNQDTVGGAKGSVYDPSTATDFGSQGGYGGNPSTPSQECDNGTAVVVHQGGKGGGKSRWENMGGE